MPAVPVERDLHRPLRSVLVSAVIMEYVHVQLHKTTKNRILSKNKNKKTTCFDSTLSSQPKCPVSELTSRPVIVNLEETDVVGKKGRRLLVVNWKVIFFRNIPLQSSFGAEIYPMGEYMSLV